jgi:hypothetical protein
MRPFPPFLDEPLAPPIEDSSPSPRVGEVVSEIGLLLAIHLAIALAVVLTLGACGFG